MIFLRSDWSNAPSVTPRPAPARSVGSPRLPFSRRWVGAAGLACSPRNSCFVFDARVADSLQPEGPHSGAATPLNHLPD